MKDRRAKHKRKGNSAESRAPGPRSQPASSRRALSFVALGLLTGVLVGVVVWRNLLGQSRGPLPAELPGLTLTAEDEVKMRKVCAHCHLFPAPDVLPRDAWNDTIWQMFAASGHGKTVRWDIDPEAIVDWYEQRAPDRFEFPEVDDDRQAAEALSLIKRSLTAASAEPAPVVSHILAADLAGDGRPELVVCDMLAGRVLLGRAGEWDRPLESIAQVASPAHAEAVDLDADGVTDLVVADLGSFAALDHNLGSVQWLRQRNDETFESITLADGFGRVADVQPSDFDGDGDIDLLVADFGWRATGKVVLLENSGAGGGSPVFVARQIDGLHGAIHVDVADLDEDGRLDIVVLYSQGHETVRCYLQRDDFAFEIRDLYRAPGPAWGFSGMQLVDLDRDEDLDVLLTNGDTFDNSILKPYHKVQWIENQGALEFAVHDLGSLYGAYRAEAADMDGDGDLDVVACALITPDSARLQSLGQRAASIVWFEQTSAGEFARHVVEIGQSHHPTLTLSDYDLDGDVDLLVGNGQLTVTAGPPAPGCIDLWENAAAEEAPTP